MVDMGMREYREFACSRRTLRWLLDGAMTHVDGVAVVLTVADETCGGNVIVQARPAVWEHEPGVYSWQEAA